MILSIVFSSSSCNTLVLLERYAARKLLRRSGIDLLYNTLVLRPCGVGQTFYSARKRGVGHTLSLSLSFHVLFGFEESFKHKLQARDTFIKYSELLIPIQVFTAYIVYQRVIKLLIPIQTLLKFSGFSFYIPSHFQNQSFNYVILVKKKKKQLNKLLWYLVFTSLCQ